MKDLIERLRDWHNTSDERNRKDMIQAADLLERVYSQPVELPEPVDDVRIHNGYEYLTTKACDDYYTADQLTQAVQEATARALEAAAKECEIMDSFSDAGVGGTFAQAIRNLIGGVK